MFIEWKCTPRRLPTADCQLKNIKNVFPAVANMIFIKRTHRSAAKDKTSMPHDVGVRGSFFIVLFR